MVSFYAHKLQCGLDREAARLRAVHNLSGFLRTRFSLSGWTNRAKEVFASTWGVDGRKVDWDWPAIFRTYDDHTRLDLAIWVENRLCGLALGILTSEALALKFLEGDSRSDCPLRGRRALIALETAQCYAQLRGRTELRVEPINGSVETLYRDIFGFTLETPRGRQAYYRREIAR